MKLECTRCKCIYSDVERVLKCPLCGNTAFEDAEFHLGRMTVVQTRFPTWFTREGTIGFFQHEHLRLDSSASLD